MAEDHKQPESDRPDGSLVALAAVSGLIVFFLTQNTYSAGALWFVVTFLFHTRPWLDRVSPFVTTIKISSVP